MYKKYPLRAFFFLLLTALNVFASAQLADASPVSVEKSTNGVTLANSQVRVEINLKDASYSVVDAKDGTIAIAHAHGEVDGLGGNPEKTFSTRQLDPHEEVSWKTNAVADALGNGTMLTLTVKRQDDREYFTTFTLHADKSFVALGSGIVNHRSYAIRVRSFQPLVGGEVFPGQKKTAMKTLNGAAGSTRAEVKEGYDRACENSLLFTCMANGKRHSLVMGGLTYQDFAKYAAIGVYELWDTYPDTKGVDLGQTWKTVWARPRGVWKEKEDFTAQVAAVDPVGRLVDPGTTYQPNDLFYVDVSTADPFQSLESYGLTLRDATKAHPNTYNNLTVCGWFSHRDTSDQLVKEMDVAVTKGMLKTIPVTVRLEPDTYCGVDNGNTEQGWWDDAHWAKYGHLTPPYDTFKKFIDAVHERGGHVETYFQCGMPSDDFAETHPDYMLHKDISLLHRRHLHVHPLVTYDPSSAGFQEHMHKVWGHLKEAGLSGVKFDYPDIAWRPEGGFEDPHATTASAYRAWFQLCRDGLGPNALIHERALGGNCLDVTTGIVDMQRVWSDSDKWEQGMASTCGLRWYKNRVVMGYYPDSKSFVAFDAAGKRLNDVPLAPLPRQALITMLYVTSGRIESALSLETLSPEVIHDIGRAFPMHSTPQSARPVDAFTGTKSPKVYSFRVDDHWQQVTFYNQEKTPVTISAPLSGEQASTGSLGLNPEKNYFVYEFWSDRLVGKFSGNAVLSEQLAPGEARMYSVREALDRPQVLSTNRHLMQGYVDLSDLNWDASLKTLSGTAKVVGGEAFRIVLAKNGAHVIKATATDAVATLEPNTAEENLVTLIISSKENKSISWKVQFE